MADDNLWELSRKKAETNYKSTDNVIRYIQGQASNIDKSIEGVSVKFTKMTGSYTTLIEAVAGFAEIASKAVKPAVNQDDVDTELKDINEKFGMKYYGFTIFNDTYRFQVFTALIPAYYPIFVRLDEDIYRELNEEGIPGEFDSDKPQMPIKDQDDLRQFLIYVFSSKKMTAVLDSLEKEHKTTEKKRKTITINGDN